MAMEDHQGTTGQKRAGAGADADYGVVVEPQSPDDTQPQSHADLDPSPKGTPARCSEANENASHTTNHAKNSGVSEGVVDMPKELPPLPPTASSPAPSVSSSHLLKKRPTSTSARPSTELFRSLMVADDDDSKSKKSSFSQGDNSSIYTVDSNDERRLSDKVKRAWRGVTGQKNLDPLEQWMVTHSGGTLRDMPVGRSYRNSSDNQ